MVASSTTMSWAVAMTSKARPRRPPPAAVAPGEAARPVTDCRPGADCGTGGPGALSAPEAGDVTVSPWGLGARALAAVRGSRQAQACRQAGKRTSPDPGDSPQRDCAGRDRGRGE